MVSLANQFAPEHLEVMTANAKELAEKLVAGLILLGPYSPVPLKRLRSAEPTTSCPQAALRNRSQAYLLLILCGG